MKSILTMAAVLASAGFAQAGGLADPVVEPVVIEEAAIETSGPSAPFVLAVTTLTILGVGASN